MTSIRLAQIAVLLPDGDVLLAGGYDDRDSLDSAELYDLETGVFRATASMASARGGASATLLADGKVLVVGGSSDKRCELYDPRTGQFHTTGSLATERWESTATLLRDGRVLIAAGAAYDQDRTLDSAELYRP